MLFISSITNESCHLVRTHVIKIQSRRHGITAVCDTFHFIILYLISFNVYLAITFLRIELADKTITPISFYYPVRSECEKGSATLQCCIIKAIFSEY